MNTDTHRYRNGRRFHLLTGARGNPYTPIVTRDDDWVVSYHKPGGGCVSGYSAHHRDIVPVEDLRVNYRVEGYTR